MTPPQLLRHTLSKEADPDHSRGIKASLEIVRGCLMVVRYIHRAATGTTRAGPDNRHQEGRIGHEDSLKEEEPISQSHH